jgi:osmoprotectant transport system permease protein
MAEGIRWDWIERHGDDIRTAVVQHVELVLISVAIAVVIAVPVAVLVRGHRIPYASVVAVGGVLYTIPSLAMFAFLVPSLGIGRGPVVVALVLYSFLILVRNTVVGLQGVPGPVLEAARGMGLTRWQTLVKVELPLALPSIVAGIRVATVSAVGIATIGALVAAGGLGDLIYLDGIARDFFLTPIVVGAVLATALAMVLDLLLLTAERALRPWARVKAAATA